MAVNLINSNDIEVEQTGQDIQLKTSTPISTIEGNIGDLTLLNITDKSSMVNAVNEIKTNMGGKILWTNNSPASSFSGQTLSNVDLTDYDMIEIFFNDAADRTMIHSTGRLPKQNGNLISQFNGSLWDRNYTISNNNITFSNGHKYATYGNNTTTDNNNAIIPIYIIGYKTGLFS